MPDTAARYTLTIETNRRNSVIYAAECNAGRVEAIAVIPTAAAHTPEQTHAAIRTTIVEQYGAAILTTETPDPDHMNTTATTDRAVVGHLIRAAETARHTSPKQRRMKNEIEWMRSERARRAEQRRLARRILTMKARTTVQPSPVTGAPAARVSFFI